MHKQRSYWQGVKARVLPALLVGLVAAAAVWVADDSIKRVALLFIFFVGFLPGCSGNCDVIRGQSYRIFFTIECLALHWLDSSFDRTIGD